VHLQAGVARIVQRVDVEGQTGNVHNTAGQPGGARSRLVHLTASGLAESRTQRLRGRDHERVGTCVACPRDAHSGRRRGSDELTQLSRGHQRDVTGEVQNAGGERDQRRQGMNQAVIPREIPVGQDRNLEMNGQRGCRRFARGQRNRAQPGLVRGGDHCLEHAEHQFSPPGGGEVRHEALLGDVQPLEPDDRLDGHFEDGIAGWFG